MTIRPTSDVRDHVSVTSALLRGLVTVVVSLCLSLVVISCTDHQSSEQVTLYVSADEHVARQVIDFFEIPTVSVTKKQKYNPEIHQSGIILLVDSWLDLEDFLRSK